MKGAEFVEHYGVKGMQWGVRKRRGNREAVKKAAGESPKAKDLSDDDLKKLVARMNLEQQYTKLINQRDKKNVGANVIKKIGNIAFNTAATAVITHQVGKALVKAKLVPPPKKG